MQLKLDLRTGFTCSPYPVLGGLFVEPAAFHMDGDAVTRSTPVQSHGFISTQYGLSVPGGFSIRLHQADDRGVTVQHSTIKMMMAAASSNGLAIVSAFLVAGDTAAERFAGV